MTLDGIDLSDAERRRIEEMHARLALASHYDRLGVARDADKKTIKRAYYALTSELHPDRFFGRALGRYRAMLDAIFRRLTEAHDALTTAARAEYDATLPPLTATPSAPPVAASSAPPAPHTTSSVPPRTVSGVHPAPSAAEIEARKQALARRLTGGARRPILTPSRPFDPKKKNG